MPIHIRSIAYTWGDVERQRESEEGMGERRKKYMTSEVSRGTDEKSEAERGSLLQAIWILEGGGGVNARGKKFSLQCVRAIHIWSHVHSFILLGLARGDRPSLFPCPLRKVDHSFV